MRINHQENLNSLASQVNSLQAESDKKDKENEALRKEIEELQSRSKDVKDAGVSEESSKNKGFFNKK